MKSFIRTLLGVFALFLVLVAGAQVVPVQPASAGMPGWAWLIIAGAGLCVAGYFYLKKHPQAVAQAEASLASHTALTNALNSAHATIDNLATRVTTPAPVAPAAPATGFANVVNFATGTVAVPHLDASIAPPAAPAAPTRNPQSNAPAGFPDTSPGGYPLWYALANGQPVGNPVLVYDGNTFGSESEVNAYKAAVAIRNLNLAAYQAPAFTGALAMSSLTPDDWCWIDSKGSVNWNAVLAGDADMFKAMTVHYFYNGLAGFNPATYEGPLKSLG